jgi:hypothetical protein
LYRLSDPKASENPWGLSAQRNWQNLLNIAIIAQPLLQYPIAKFAGTNLREDLIVFDCKQNSVTGLEDWRTSCPLGIGRLDTGSLSSLPTFQPSRMITDFEYQNSSGSLKPKSKAAFSEEGVFML